MRNEVLQELTRTNSTPTACHLGMNKTLSKVRLRFYWVEMRVDIRSFIRQCSRLEEERDALHSNIAEVRWKESHYILWDHFPPQKMAISAIKPKFVEAYSTPNENW